MDPEVQNRLNDILTKEPTGLTAADVEFLRARREYLTPEQAETYASILSNEPQTIVHVISQEDLDANPGIESDLKVGDEVELPANPMPLEEMTKADLLETAALSKIEISSSATKAEIIEKIHASHTTDAVQ